MTKEKSELGVDQEGSTTSTGARASNQIAPDSGINPLDHRAADLIEAAGVANRKLGAVQAVGGDPWDANEAVYGAEEALRDYCRGVR